MKRGFSSQLNRPHPQRAAHLEAGLEFAELAEVALGAGMLRGFHENAFHAAEHLAKAELLSYAAALPEIADSRTHGRLRGTYQLWAHLGNTDPKFARLLDDLDKCRAAFTYARGEDARQADVARIQHGVLLDMIKWVRQVASGHGRKVISLYATDNVRAGQLVSRDNTGLRPPDSNS